MEIVLAYIGDEQPSWGRTAFHTPRHYFVMPAILYLQASLRAAGRADVRAIYLNRSVQQFDEMFRLVAGSGAGVVGLSCYSWNFDDTLALASALRRKPDGPLVILGGPEVTFGEPSEAIGLLEAQPAVDAVVLGEGEGVIADVVDVLCGATSAGPIAGAVFRAGDRLIAGPRDAPPVDLATVPEIDPAKVDVPLSAGTGLAVVYQTYRGCPYSCAYCSFHGGAHGIRSFALERVERELSALFEARVPCIHFADSVFDRRRARAKQILDLCSTHNRETSLFCYAAFQKLDPELADLFERTRIQVGVGLQSVDEQVLARVGRRFDVQRFEESLELIEGRRVNWYVDVMFGLPGDDLDGFRRTVERVIDLEPTFVMPFPLTVIPRTALAADLEGFEVVRYDDARVRSAIRPGSGMVYENVGLSREIDLDDLGRFDDVATAIFVAMQRFPRTARVLIGYSPAFEVLELIGRRIKDRLDGAEIDPANPPLIDGAIREAAASLMTEQGASPVELDAVAALLRVEAAIEKMLGASNRREAHRRVTDRVARRVELREIDDDALFEQLTVAFSVEHRLTRSPFAFVDLEQLHELRGGIEPRDTHIALLAPYDDFEVRAVELDPTSRSLCELIPSSREVALPKVIRRVARGADRDSVRVALRRLVDVGLLGVYRPTS
ncbi:MAG: radical SAM protein [Deltaproteobacteria bacterium]|nr:radical SAM protein [Deltaproteobacteria bacterium]